ncbi:MAG: universal stress protein [Symploca sp. SIO3C6]|uniref:Universal stress protein n=1 Tax=Symploca sp. SIO1C4 TaxID=2607765 RepID=A0A6B3N2P0_9CYAN|nr:universal stress protein [Symploca sp. SIO3C6]NER27966.1 universal stress protein [Symploca sp. SIO1C4]NET08000.1 universal stress protein [Symploca sp. SIO2B6]
MFFKKILVAIDKSPQAARVFAEAIKVARIEESHLMLLHCLDSKSEEPMAPFLGIGTLADVDMYHTAKQIRQENLQQEIEQAQDWLLNYSQLATAKDISTEIYCGLGDPGSLICTQAKNWGADLIVLGRRGRQGLAEVFLGSVSNYVVHHSPCSVLVVQGFTTSDTLEAETNVKVSGSQ